MVPALKQNGPHEDDLLGGQWPERRVGFSIVIGIAAIGAVIAMSALISTKFNIGPQLPMVAYLVLAFSAVLLFCNFMITLIRDEFRAGFYLVAFWSIALLVLLVMLRFVG